VSCNIQFKNLLTTKSPFQVKEYDSKPTWPQSRSTGGLPGKRAPPVEHRPDTPTFMSLQILGHWNAKHAKGDS